MENYIYLIIPFIVYSCLIYPYIVISAFQDAQVSILPGRLQTINANGSLSQRRDAESMTKTLLGIRDIVVRDSCMGSDSIIPERNRLVIPLDTNL